VDFVSSVNVVIIVQMVVAVFLPILVGLVTNQVTSSSTKATLLAALSVVSTALTGFIAAANAGQPFDLGMAVVTAVSTFSIAVATHFGLWKPTGTAAAAQSVSATTLVNRNT
jgi:hypothetical protein